MALVGIGDRVEGLHAVEAAARASRVTELFVESGVASRDEIAVIVDLVESEGGRVTSIADIGEIAETAVPQGLVAEARPIPAETLANLVSRSRLPALVVLDHLQDPQNVGAIARSARAAGMTGLVVAERRAAPMGPAVFKAAAGALETLPVAVVSSVAAAVGWLKENAVWTVGLDAAGSGNLLGLELLGEPVALFVGSEGSGLSRLVTDRIDVTAHIPTTSDFSSLNASVAAAVGMFEIGRVRSSRAAAEG